MLCITPTNYYTKYINDFVCIVISSFREFGTSEYKLKYSLAGGEQRRHAFESRRAGFSESRVGAKAKAHTEAGLKMPSGTGRAYYYRSTMTKTTRPGLRSPPGRFGASDFISLPPLSGPGFSLFPSCDHADLIHDERSNTNAFLNTSVPPAENRIPRVAKTAINCRLSCSMSFLSRCSFSFIAHAVVYIQGV